MSAEQQQEATQQAIAGDTVAAEQPSTALARPSSLQTRTSPYSSGLYGGSSMYGGGMYGGGMGMGMGGMGMGMGGMGMNRFGMNRQQPGGMRQDYQNVFQGLRALLQMGFSAFGLFTYGKMFGNMMIKMMKFAFRKTKDGVKILLAWTVFNRYSTKVMNGVFTKVSKKNGGVFNIVFKAVFSIGVLGLSLIWFLMKSNDIEEQESEILMKMKRKRQEKMRKLKEFEEYYDNLQKKIEDAMKKENEAEKLFTQALEEHNSEEGEEEGEEEEGGEEEGEEEEEENVEIMKEGEEEGEIKEEVETQLDKPGEKKSTSEEFWMKKESKLKKQLQAFEDGEALNKLFNDEDSFEVVGPQKYTKQESIKLENDILLSWPTLNKAVVEDACETLPPVMDKSTSLQKELERKEGKEIADLGSIFDTVAPPAKKPWMR